MGGATFINTLSVHCLSRSSLDSWVVCVCGWPSELQTGLLSAVTAHRHHNTLTPNTMLARPLSLCALHGSVSEGAVTATVQNTATSGSHDNVIQTLILDNTEKLQELRLRR